MKFKIFFLTLIALFAFSSVSFAEDITYLEGSWNENTQSVDFTQKTATDPIKIEATTTTWGTWSNNQDQWYYVTGDVTINATVIVDGTVNLILCDGASLTVNEGIDVLNTGTSMDILNIYAQSAGTGSLTARGCTDDTDDVSKFFRAGIGSGTNVACGTVTIHGGTVTAASGLASGGAGIGGGSKNATSSIGNGGTVTIYGGTVNAINSKVGIGSMTGSVGTVTINGGTVTAIGVSSRSDGGAGIGSDYDEDCGTVTINGGTVTATGGNGGAGIGGGSSERGYRGSGGNIRINGGIVNATGGNSAPGIGHGRGASGGNIRINGGTVNATGGNGAKGIDGTVTISDGYVVATGGSDTAAGIGGNVVSVDLSRSLYTGSDWELLTIVLDNFNSLSKDVEVITAKHVTFNSNADDDTENQQHPDKG